VYAAGQTAQTIKPESMDEAWGEPVFPRSIQNESFCQMGNKIDSKRVVLQNETGVFRWITLYWIIPYVLDSALFGGMALPLR
jgi:hypothetical protein